jgi:hypothetical protein
VLFVDKQISRRGEIFEHEPLRSNLALAISDELREKHDQSVRRYPFLNLSEGEYVILDMKRHPMGMIIPIALTGLSLFAILFLLCI